jgi:hypothetical protein
VDLIGFLKTVALYGMADIDPRRFRALGKARTRR